MKRGKTQSILRASLLAIFLGAPFLFWYYCLDGQAVDRPLTFIRGVDPMDLQTEKASYAPGEDVRAYTAFCKNRPSVATTQWTLSDRFLTVYAPKAAKQVPDGCYPDQGTELFEIEPLPASLPAGCDYFFAGITQEDIGGGRAVAVQYRTRTFCVTAPPQPLAS